jgi:hypothetical protein
MSNQGSQIVRQIVQRYFKSDISPISGKPTPHKFLLTLGEEDVELSIFPTSEGALPPILEGIDLANIEGKEIEAIATWKDTYKNPKTGSVKQQYKLEAIRVVGEDTPAPQQEKAEQPAPKPEKNPIPQQPPVVQTDKDTLIVDQVILKGAVDLRASGIDATEAVSTVIAFWEAIRARHNVPPPPDDDDDEDGESFGAIQLGDE